MSEKKKKKKGPIRTEAIVPFIIFMGLVIGFNILFLDSSLRKGFEYGAEQVNGAQVDIANVNTSLSDLSMRISGIQMTDKNNPEYNKVQIGAITLNLLWDGLLRAKFVIEKSEIKDILVNTKRKKAGYVLPPPPPSDESSKQTQAVLNRAKEKFKGNVFGDIAGVLGGASVEDTGKNIQGELASEKGMAKLEQEIDQKQADMDKKLKDVPTKEDINKLNQRIKKVKWNDLGNLKKAPGVLKEIDKIKKDIDKANKAVNKANKAVNNNIKTINQSYKKAQNLVDDDINAIGKRMNLPSLDPKTIAQMLFGNEMINQLEELKKYQDLAKKYIPKKKNKAQAIKPERSSGKNYQFGRKNSYPLFWLKTAKINSKNDQGEVSGEINDVTNDQNLVGKLTTANIKADFPSQNIRDISATFELDHRTEPILKTKSTVGSFPVSDKALSESDDVEFVIKKANTRSEIIATLTEKDVKMQVNNLFRDIQYHTKAKQEQVNLILADVAKKTNVLTLNATGKGSWDDIQFDINSNLAKAIQNSTSSLVQEKINKARDKIKKDVEAKVAKSKKKVDDKISAFKNKYEKQLKAGKNQLAKLKKDLNKKKKKAQKDATKGGKNLLKNIKL